MFYNALSKSLFITLAIVGFGACDTSDQYLPEDVTTTGTVLSILANKSSEGSTKVAYSNNTVVWTSNDQIGVYGVTNNGTPKSNIAYLLDNASAGHTTGTFTGSELWGAGSYDFFFYYPYSSKALDITHIPIRIPCVQEQASANSSEHIRAYKYLYTSLRGVTLTQATEDLSLLDQAQFKNLTSTFRFIISGLQGNVRITSITATSPQGKALAFDNGVLDLTKTNDPLTISKGYTSVMVKIGGTGATQGLGNGDTATMIVRNLGAPIAGSTQNFTFSFTTNENKTYVRTDTEKNGTAWKLPLGARLNVIQDIEIVATHFRLQAKNEGKNNYAPDGSKILDVEGHANCYIVNTNSKFKFNAGYQGSSSDTLYVSGASLEPVWGDNLVTLTGLSSKGEIYFTTKSQEGNALICLKKEGKIIWSWHIWITDDPIGTVDLIGSNGDGGTFMDRNLGAMANVPSNGKDAAGLYYQWGRKDPFQRNNTNCSISEGSRTWDDNNTAGFLKMSIEHPTIWYYYWTGSEPNHYMRDNYRYDQSWALYSPGDNPNGSCAPGKNKYDPCPIGWRVPTTSEMGYISKVNLDKYENETSYFLNGLILPATGLLDRESHKYEPYVTDNGGLGGIRGGNCYLWTSSKHYNILFIGDNVITGASPRSSNNWYVYKYNAEYPDVSSFYPRGFGVGYDCGYAHAVRCVKIPE